MKDCFIGNKGNIKNILFDIMWILFISYSILNQSAWAALDETGMMNNVFRAVKIIASVLCLIVIIINFSKRIYTFQSIIAYAFIGIIIAVSAYYSRDLTYVWYFPIFAAAYKQDAKRVVTLSAIVTALMMIIIMGSCYIGLNIDYLFDSDQRVRHGLGFGWTTTSAIMFLFFILEYLYIRENKAHFFEYIILEALAVFFFLMTKTQFTFIVTTFILVYMFVEECLRKKSWFLWRKLKWFWIVVPALVLALTVLIFIKYDYYNDTWYNIDILMHGRLILGQRAITNYGFTIFGQPIEWLGYYITRPVVDGYNYVDCSYIQLMLEYGIAFIVMTVAMYMNALYNSIKSDKYYLVFILMVVIVFSFVEPRLMNMAFNVFPLMAFMAQPESKTSVKIKSISST